MLSIITPVLNGAKFIEQNIQSIEKLTIPYEHIIVDGGSTDGTLDIIARFPHIKLLHQKDNLGMYKAIDMGFRIAKGEYLTWVNADDMVIANGYDKLYKSAVNRKADLAYSHGVHHFIDKYYYKKHFARFFVRKLLKTGVFPFVQPSVIFSAKAYYKVGGLNYENFRLIGDRDLFQRMAYDSELSFLFVPVISSVFLRYDNSLLYRNLEKKNQEYKYCIKTNITLFHRIIYHSSQVIRNITWVLNNKRI